MKTDRNYSAHDEFYETVFSVFPIPCFMNDSNEV